jgi:hypothetical protein
VNNEIDRFLSDRVAVRIEEAKSCATLSVVASYYKSLHKLTEVAARIDGKSDCGINLAILGGNCLRLANRRCVVRVADVELVDYHSR